MDQSSFENVDQDGALNQENFEGQPGRTGSSNKSNDHNLQMRQHADAALEDGHDIQNNNFDRNSKWILITPTDQYENEDGEEEYENEEEDEDYKGGRDYFGDVVDNQEQDEEEDRELIYNEDSGHQHIEKLFDDDGSEEPAVYEIEFKIFDKTSKNVIDLIIAVTLRQGRTRETELS